MMHRDRSWIYLENDLKAFQKRLEETNCEGEVIMFVKETLNLPRRLEHIPDKIKG